MKARLLKGLKAIEMLGSATEDYMGNSVIQEAKT